MTVKDLIQKLEQLDSNQEVVTITEVGMGEYVMCEDVNVDVGESGRVGLIGEGEWM